MSVLLAIEPDRRQAARLTALARGPLLAEIVIGETTESAFAALGARVPDLVLTSLLLSPKDESALADRLRELDAAGRHVQTLVIPVLGGSSETEGRRSKGFFGRLMKSGAKTTTDGCDPAVFGDQIREYLERSAAERAATAAAQADLDAAWSEEPPAGPAAKESFALPAESSYHARAEDEAPTPWAFSAATEQTAADTFHRESISIETETAVLASEPSSVEPDFTEQLRAQLSPVVEPDPPTRSQPEMLDPEPQVEAPVVAALDSDIAMASPEPEYRFEAKEPELVIAAWEPQSSVQPVVDPVGEAAASKFVFDVAATSAKPPAQDEEWEEISLEAAGDHDAPSEIVSETIDIEALMRELRAVESDGASDDVGPSSHAMSFPPLVQAPAPELSADFGAIAPPSAPPVAQSSDAPPPRPSLDLEAFAAALKLAATPVVPEPPPEPPPVPRSSPFQSGWRDVLSAIRRDIDQLQEEKPSPAPTPRSARDRAFEPLVFPARPAPAAEALSRIEPPVPTRVEPPPPPPTEVPVLAQLEEAVRSLIKPLAKKPREAAPAPPVAEIVVSSPVMPVLAATMAPPAIEITPAPDLAPDFAPVVVTPPVVAPPPVKQTVAAPPAVEIVVPSPAMPVLAATVAPPAIEIIPAPDLAPVVVAPPVVAPPAFKQTVAAPEAIAPPAAVVSVPVVSVAPPELDVAPVFERPAPQPLPSIEITPPPLAPVVVAPPAVVSVPVVNVAPPEPEGTPVFDRPAPKPLPSPLELLSSLGLEPVDVLVPDPVSTIEPEPVEQPDELFSASTDLHDHHAVLVEPTSRRSSKSKKKRRIEQPKPTVKTPYVDDWGFFDPQKVGFATLLSKLNEIADGDERAALPRR